MINPNILNQLQLASLTTTGKAYSMEENNQVLVGKNNTMNDTGQLKLAASVVLPPSLFTYIAANMNATEIGIFFSIYKTASLLQISNVSNTTTAVVPLIIGATVVGVKTDTIRDPVRLNFTLPNKVSTFPTLKRHSINTKMCHIEQFKIYLR